MRKILTAALAALTLGGAVAATTATSADAAPRGWHGGYGYHGGGYYRGYGPGLAVGAGLLGLAVGASLASPYYGPGYYAPGPGYYAGPASYGYYGGCPVHYRWNPYAGRYYPVQRCY